MGTQGLISIVRQGQVVAKIVTGHDGGKIPQVAKALDAYKPQTAEEIEKVVRNAGIGSSETLVVMVRVQDEIMVTGNFDRDELLESSPRYFQTFDDPFFNPRWENGTAEFTQIVKY